MSRYHLKDHVTDEMLQAFGFSFEYGKAVNYTTNTCTTVRIKDKRIVLYKESCVSGRDDFGGCDLWIREIPMVKKYIKDLLDLNYVEVKND